MLPKCQSTNMPTSRHCLPKLRCRRVRLLRRGTEAALDDLIVVCTSKMRPHPELPIIPIPLETLLENVERTNGRGRGSEKCVCLISPQSFLPSSLPPSTAHPSSSDSAPANPMPQKAVAQLLLLLFISICFTYTCARWRVVQTQKRGCSSLACQSCHATI